MPGNVPSREEQMQAVRIGPLIPLTGLIEIAEYDPICPQLYQREKERIQSALGNRILEIEHVGSTSVPGLAAKPRIDILLVVASSANEASSVPRLEKAGYG